MAEQLARHHELPLDDLLDRVLAHAHGDATDDIALLAVRMHPEDRPRPAEAGPSTD